MFGIVLIIKLTTIFNYCVISLKNFNLHIIHNYKEYMKYEIVKSIMIRFHYF